MVKKTNTISITSNSKGILILRKNLELLFFFISIVE